jgi:hypothetical protein
MVSLPLVPLAHPHRPHGAQRQCPCDRRSMLGGVAAGPALGAMIQWAGARSVPLVLCVIALLCLVSSMWIDRTPRPRGRGEAASSRRRRHHHDIDTRSAHSLAASPAISSRISAPMPVNRSLSTIQLSRDRLSLAMMSLGTVQGEDRHE